MEARRFSGDHYGGYYRLRNRQRNELGEEILLPRHYRSRGAGQHFCDVHEISYPAGRIGANNGRPGGRAGFAQSDLGDQH